MKAILNNKFNIYIISTGSEKTLLFLIPYFINKPDISLVIILFITYKNDLLKARKDYN